MVPSALGETLSSRVPFLLTVSTSQPITVSGELALRPSTYPQLFVPIGLSTTHDPLRMPSGGAPSKSIMEAIVFVFVPEGANAAFFVVNETSLPQVPLRGQVVIATKFGFELDPNGGPCFVREM